MEKRSYYTKNNTRRGEAIGGGFTYGMEHETNDSDEIAHIELQNIDFIPTEDGSLGCYGVEYKSPIWKNAKSAVKATAVIDRLLNGEHIEINENCGTHLHIGHVAYINPVTMDYIRRFYHSLFVPLCEAMNEHPHETAKLFGRDFTYYARRINRNSNVLEHTNFINVQHDHTIEFRLNKFTSGKQYATLIMLEKAMVSAIIENFIKHFDDRGNDTEHRLHKASVTANKLVKLYLKAIAEM